MIAFTSLQPRESAPRAVIDADTLVRSILFVAVFIAVLTSCRPFPSLADRPTEVSVTGDLVNQIVFPLLFLLLATWTFFNQPRQLLPLLRASLIAVLSWCVISIVSSFEPLVAARRFMFTIVVMGIAAMLLLLPKHARHFADLLAIIALAVLAACYAGVFFLPSRAIHQATDFLNPDLAGDWRGLFGHKNDTGAIMVLLTFAGLYVARVRGLIAGMIIVVSAAIFLVFTHSKTSISMLPLVLVASAMLTRCRATVGIALTISIVLVANLFTVGSVYFSAIHNVVQSLMADPSFTGRSDIWEFAIQNVARRPITGFGFSTFWGTEQVAYGMSLNEKWANTASHAHNSYLNMLLTIGLPGLMLSILWLVIMPLVDFYHHSARDRVGPLSVFFLQIYLYGVFSSSLESVFFMVNGNVWFMLLIAVFGLRLLSASTLRI